MVVTIQIEIKRVLCSGGVPGCCVPFRIQWPAAIPLFPVHEPFPISVTSFGVTILKSYFIWSESFASRHLEPLPSLSRLDPLSSFRRNVSNISNLEDGCRFAFLSHFEFGKQIFWVNEIFPLGKGAYAEEPSDHIARELNKHLFH